MTSGADGDVPIQLWFDDLWCHMTRRRYFRYRFSGNYLTRIRVTVAGAFALTGESSSEQAPTVDRARPGSSRMFTADTELESVARQVSL